MNIDKSIIALLQSMPQVVTFEIPEKKQRTNQGNRRVEKISNISTC